MSYEDFNQEKLINYLKDSIAEAVNAKFGEGEVSIYIQHYLKNGKKQYRAFPGINTIEFSNTFCSDFYDNEITALEECLTKLLPI